MSKTVRNRNRLRGLSPGVSLTELLVTIGIGALLVSILLPGLSQARCRVRSRSCASNLREIGRALQVYARDWSNTLPYAEGSALPKTFPTRRYPQGSIATSLRLRLQPYVRRVQAFECPNDCGVPGFGTTGRAWELFGSSYLWNDGLEREAGGTARLSVNGAALTSIKAPSRTPMCWDYSPEWHHELVRNGASLVMAGRLNVVYVDGHVRELQPVIAQESTLQTGPEAQPRTETIR